MLSLNAKYLRIQRDTIMLLPDNIHPELCVYYNGAIVLNELKQNNKQQLINLYQKISRSMSFSTFILCLDWLYLIDVARINEGGIVELCL